MKGLLLKEFYIWLKTRSWVLIYIAAMSIFAGYSGSGGISAVGIGILVGQISQAFLHDEKSGWRNYSKALPCTPFERVTSRYIITSAEFLIGIIAHIISKLISQKITDDKLGNLFIYSGDAEFYTELALTVACFTFYLAIMLPLCFKFKGTLRTVTVFLPMVFFIVAYMMLFSASLLGNLIILSEPKYIPVLIVAVSLIALALSWTVSVIIESGTDSRYKNKFAKIAIILTVIAVAAASVTIVSICNSYENRKADKYGEYNSISNTKEVMEEINNYYDLFCNELHIDTDFDAFAEELKSAGFVQDENRKDYFTSESGNIMIDLGMSFPSGQKISTVYVTCKNATKTFETATYNSLKNIEMCFYEEMTQTALYDEFNRLGIIPYQITEQVFNGTDYVRRYTFKFLAAKFEDEENSVEYTLNIDTENGIVTSVDDLMMFVSDNRVVPDETTETPAETAAREIKEYADNFCGESNITKTPREFIKELRIAGFKESENAYDYFYSPDRKVSVALDTDDDDKLRNITVIANFGMMKTVDSDEKLDKLASEIAIGTEEKALIEKLDELDALPDSIIEDFTSDNKQRRTYEIKYTVEDPDGGITCSVTVETVNGIVTDVTVF